MDERLGDAVECERDGRRRLRRARGTAFGEALVVLLRVLLGALLSKSIGAFLDALGGGMCRRARIVARARGRARFRCCSLAMADPARHRLERRERHARARAFLQRVRPFRERLDVRRHAARRERVAQRGTVAVVGIDEQRGARRRSRRGDRGAQIDCPQIGDEIGRVAVAEDVEPRFFMMLLANRGRRRIEPALLHDRQLAQIGTPAHDGRERDECVDVGRVLAREREHRERGARAQADERDLVDRREIAQRGERAAHARDARGLPARREIVACRIAGARIVKAQHPHAVVGQALGERANHLVRPQRLMAERLADHGAAPRAALMQPSQAIVESNWSQFSILGRMVLLELSARTSIAGGAQWAASASGGRWSGAGE
ncbi:Uncharacterised protein [Burkholderia pseudomallei]|nr:hypothetical protein DM52_3169 [Burkholderia mallei]CAJ3850902.1 Uncharacterised protein [Burkholderia pseudomallei]CAJ8429834.1 Uncharacterised protein [Burkholderia pseudomallei]